MVASPDILGPSVGPNPLRSFDARPATSEPELDRQIERLGGQKREFARLAIQKKIGLLRDIQRRMHEVSREWVEAACRAKGIPFDAPVAGEEWLGGPAITLRNVRFLIRALEDVQKQGVPALDEARMRDLAHGAVAIGVTPYDGYDRALYGNVTAETWLRSGIPRHEVGAYQAAFYKKKDPQGGLSLILGAGNVASIPPMDVLYKMFVDGNVCLLKMNPVNEYLGKFFERAFKTLIDAGYLAIAYGGAEVGSYLCYHPHVDDVHITGSDKTHDAIVWGPPGAEREDRKRRNDPILKKPITSELGNVSPVIVLPGPYTDAELLSMAENVAGMVTQNASFNCNAAKMLVLPKGWSHRERFIANVSDVLARVPPRKAYYPGAFQRFDALTSGHGDVRKIGARSDQALPWTLILGLDAGDEREQNFVTEPFCSILNEVSIGSTDVSEFLAAAVPFANDRVWGTLNAMLFVHPKLEASSEKTAIDGALRDLRYGTVAINAWPAFAYALCSTPWGGHPSATLTDIQSGLGWVHNTVMLEDIEKCVVRAPLKPVPKPIYFPSHKTLNKLAERVENFEASPSWLKVPALALAAMGG